jgi:hypothetical protein
MVSFAFIFLAVLLLTPMLLVMTWDLFFGWLHPDPRVRRGFEVVPVPKPPIKP